MRITLQRTDGVLRVRLNRPERRNALDGGVWQELRDVLRDVADDPDVSVVVLEAAGPVFCAGIDLKEPVPEGSWQERRLWGRRWQSLLDDLQRLPQTSVAAVHGPAIAGGVMLAISCDLRIASTEASFRIPELSVGMPITWGCMPRLVHTVGLPRAQDLVLTGRPLSAAEALDWGLVQRVAPPSEFPDAVDELVKQLAAVEPALLSQTRQSLLAAARGENTWADADLLVGAVSEKNDEKRTAGDPR